ncbi:MAG: cytochrome c oxidase subunit II [Chloroflexi bacterium RIFCSPLOWO2_12_FULL_71_12]|nr:MAG: cytochrome c oxidase subunit II [Chloroflexi bacterium GWC2_70_10]OGO73817.1 MAG: cytochrome c oxidase subunit II [Chloroflexi bacterium RIFCSPLOWO2_12_FULL_71_12]
MPIPPWVNDPAGPVAREIVPLYWFMFGAAVIVLAIVLGALVYSGVRFRERPGVPAKQFHGHNLLELAWTVIPTIMVITFSVLSFQRLLVLSDVQTGAEMTIKVHARQWTFDFQYPEDPMFRLSSGTYLRSPERLDIPVNTKVALELTSTDVIHSFFVSNLGGKIDAVPGRTTRLWLQADRVGQFKGQCFEFCGDGHADMLITVVVHPQNEYGAWAASAVKEADRLDAPETRAGRELFRTLACAGCHTIDGLTAGKFPGAPDLTRVASQESIAGGRLSPVNEENLTRWIKDPPAVKPGTAMPNLGLDDDTVSKLVQFLLTLK